MKTVALIAGFLVLTSHVVLSRDSRLFNNYIEDVIEKSGSDEQKTIRFVRRSKVLSEVGISKYMNEANNLKEVFIQK